MSYEAELWVCTEILNFTGNRLCTDHRYTEPGLEPPICARRTDAGNESHRPAPMKSLGTYEFQEEVAV